MRNLLLDNSLFGRFLWDLGFPLGCISIHSSGRADDTLCSAVTRAVNGCRKRSGNEENGPTITTSFSSTSPGSGGAGEICSCSLRDLRPCIRSVTPPASVSSAMAVARSSVNHLPAHRERRPRRHGHWRARRAGAGRSFARDTSSQSVPGPPLISIVHS
jgi:hypothetical protein